MYIQLAYLWTLLLAPIGQADSRIIVDVQNSCDKTSEKFLGRNHTILHDDIRKGHRQHLLTPSVDFGYPLVVCSDTICQNYGNMIFLPGRRYNVKISKCNLPGIVIRSHEVHSGGGNGQPPQIRFRSRKVAPIEFRHDRRKYRRLSVGMSRYTVVEWPSPELGTVIQFRYLFISKGPVAYSSKHIISLRSGHRYFVEVQYFGDQKEMFKLQDEGVLPQSKQ